MKAHIVGGGFGGLAAAALLIRNAEVPGQDITIYEAEAKLGGGYFLEGNPAQRLQSAGLRLRQGIPLRVRTAARGSPPLPTRRFPSGTSSSPSITRNPYNDQAHILDRDGHIVHGPHFGLGLSDALALGRVSLTPESVAGRAPHQGVLFP